VHERQRGLTGARIGVMAEGRDGAGGPFTLWWIPAASSAADAKRQTDFYPKGSYSAGDAGIVDCGRLVIVLV